MYKLRLATLIPVLLTAAASVLVAHAAEFSFIGNWYGIGEPDDSSISYIDSYSADGTFHSEFRRCEHGEVVWRQTETGKWTIKDGVLRMIADTIDGKPFGAWKDEVNVPRDVSRCVVVVFPADGVKD